MLKFMAAAFVAAGALSLGSAAEARILDHVQVKVGVSGVLPDEKAKIQTIGGDVDISDEYVPSLQLEYFVNDNVSVELLCCIARHEVTATNTALGDVDLGKVSHFPPTVTVKYRWTEMGPFQPYVGAGVNYTHFFDVDSGAVDDVNYDDSFGGAVQLGFDYRLNDHWAVNVDARKIWINSDVDVTVGTTHIGADVDIDPWVLSTGIGYRF